MIFPRLRTSEQRDTSNSRRDLFIRTFDLGFTAFGGPPVHFQILHKRFVESNGKPPWIDEQTYQQLFSICQALPGPASTKLTFCITFLHAGFLWALLVFLIWSLPGAIGMYGLSLGIARIDPILPGPVYALISGLNASTVGIIALAAVQLARKAITDPLTRLIVLCSACAGLCYNALWYFPVIMIIGGFMTVIWDQWLRGKVGRIRAKMNGSERSPRTDEEAEITQIEMAVITPSTDLNEPRQAVGPNQHTSSPSSERPAVEDHYHRVPLKVGIAIIVGCFSIFTALMVTRSTIKSPPLSLQLFSNMFLAGTIIFGGGPVVIPLLRSYVVDPGWVSSRDFLIGLALIQAFPGPNFNFAVYLGALTFQSTKSPSILGAILGFVGIFFPGLTLALGFQALWRIIRLNRFVVSTLRGVNAAAVGLVFTAVHRLWEIGYLKPGLTTGLPLGSEPWWVVVAGCAYVGVDSFGIPTALGIIGGGVLGLAWYGVVKE